MDVLLGCTNDNCCFLPTVTVSPYDSVQSCFSPAAYLCLPLFALVLARSHACAFVFYTIDVLYMFRIRYDAV